MVGRIARSTFDARLPHMAFNALCQKLGFCADLQHFLGVAVPIANQRPLPRESRACSLVMVRRYSILSSQAR